jgi:Mn-dependent DtxR family transcriptional regulator
MTDDSLSDSEKLVLLFLHDWQRPIRLGDLYQILQERYYYSQTQQNLNYFIKKLRNNHYLSWKPHSRIELKDKGKEYALHISWHRHLLEKYFEETLDLTLEETKHETLTLTPVVSCNFIAALVRKYHQDDCELKQKIKSENLCFEK